jgi:hypothetical protein
LAIVREDEHLPKHSYTPAESEWGAGRWSRPFSWWALLGVVATIALAFFGDFGDFGDWGFAVAMVGAAVVAMLLVAPSLFTASPSQPRSAHPDPDVRALANGEIDIAEYRAREEAKEKNTG